MRRRSSILALIVLCVAAVAAVVAIFYRPGPIASPSSASYTVDCGNPTGQPIPLGGIPVRDICDSIVEVPYWQNPTKCPIGQVRFRHGAGGTAPLTETFERVVYTDIGRDGEMETLALLSCGDQGLRRQVVVLNRRGDMLVARQVIVTAYPVVEIFDLAGTPEGEIRVEVGNYPTVPGAENTESVRQWQTFRQGDHEFTRTDTEQFPAHSKVSDLYLWAPQLRFKPLFEGRRTGLLTIHLTNSGSVSVPFTLTVNLPSYATLKTIPPECRLGQTSAKLVCQLPGLSSDRSLTYELTVYATPEATISQEPIKWTMEASPDPGYADLGQNPNQATYDIWFE